MLELIPIQIYTPLYYYVMIFVVLMTYLQLALNGLENKQAFTFTTIFGHLFLFFILAYMGFRPVDKVFVDMVSYADRFQYYKSGGEIFVLKDVFFQVFTKYLSNIVDLNTYFFLCAALYVLPLFFASKRLFGKYWFYSFLFLAASFSFWAYGTNGIRNGISTSLFILAISFKDKRLLCYGILALSFLFHKAMILPIVAFFITQFNANTKVYFSFWVLTIVLSLTLGGFWENLFANLGIDEERLSYFSADVDADKFSNTGFRWDFLIYSATAVTAGFYFVLKRKYSDPLYLQIFHIYLFCNGIWILLIRANFSNRFAYLSWFIMALVIIYPLLKVRIFKSQGMLMGQILILYYLITFTLNVILS